MVPFLDLKAQYASIGPELEAAVVEVLRSTHYVLGPKVAAFETGFAATCGVRHAVAVNSGTTALTLALQALGIGPGDAIITVPLTFVATVAAIEQVGARPVLVDVDPATRAMDPELLEAAVTPDVRAVIPVHLHGLPADMDAISAVAERHGLVVIEDAAQAHGAGYKGRPAGSLGRLGCFSFYPAKNLGAAGEGGAVVTDDDELASVLRSLRDWGQEGKSNHTRKGTNARMEAIQGAVLEVKLRHLGTWVEARRRLARAYTTAIADGGLADSGVVVPTLPQDRDSAYHVYAVEVPDRDNVRRRLDAEGISTAVHYPVPVHRQPGHADLGYAAGAFPVSERLASRLLSLPLYPEMPATAVDEVVAALSRAVREGAAGVGRTGT